MISFVNVLCVKNSEKLLSLHVLCVFPDLTGLAEENAADNNGTHGL